MDVSVHLFWAGWKPGAIGGARQEADDCLDDIYKIMVWHYWLLLVMIKQQWCYLEGLLTMEINLGIKKKFIINWLQIDCGDN